MKVESDVRRELQKRIFAVLGTLSKILDIESETLRVRMLLKTNRFELVAMPPDWFPPVTDSDGNYYQPPGPPWLRPGFNYVAVVQSMAKQLMDEDGMRAFWDDMRAIIINEILPTLGEGDRAHIADLINGG